MKLQVWHRKAWGRHLGRRVREGTFREGLWVGGRVGCGVAVGGQGVVAIVDGFFLVR